MASIKQLKSFIMVADLQSFTKAADALYMTQPAISWQIKALEDHVGLPLFERNDKRVILTEAGKQFYRDCKEMVAVYHKAMEVMDDFKGLQRGKLELGASTIPGEYLLPKYIGEFRKDFPGVVVSLTIGDTGNIIELLLDRRINLAVVGAKVHHDDIQFIPFLPDELILIAGADSNLKQEIEISDLIKLSFVMRERNSGTQMVLNRFLEEYGINEEQLTTVMALGSAQAVITAVSAGLGVAFVSRWAAEAGIRSGAIKQILVKDMVLKRDLYISTLKNTHANRVVDAFNDLLRAASM